MRRVRFTGSKMADSLDQVMTPKPRLTPHSTMEPLTGRISLNSSYKAKKRVRFWRRTYLGKFSILTSQLSGLRSKQVKFRAPSSRSAEVRRPPATLIGSCSDIDVVQP